MHEKVGRYGGNIGGEVLPEVRAGLVLVKPKGWQHNTSRSRVRTWVLPLMRLIALAACMLCLTPTRGMGTGISSMDAWIGGSEEASKEDRRSHGGGTQRHEHIVFVGVSEEIGVLPLKALAQEMISRGYRASLALPQGFQSWVEDIPGLSFLSLNTDTATNPNQSATENKQQYQHQGGGAHASNPFPCPTQPLGFGKTACARDGLGDSWGGGVGAGWGAGLGLWGGLRGSLEGAREFLGHLKAYLGFYYREEAAMFAPLVEVLRRDPPALVVADRRALAAFRACSELGLRCVVNSPGLLGDLDRPPSSIPAPYTGFPTEGLTIAQRLHSNLIRLVMSLSRLQAARELGFGGSYVQLWASLVDESYSSFDESVVSSTVLALGNSCFGSLEHPRELPSSVHMVGPLWMKNSGSRPSGGGDDLAPDSYAQDHAVSSGGFRGEHEANLEGGRGGGGDVVAEEVWAWLEPEGAKEGDEAPVVVVQLGFGGGEAWGVSPDAALSAETLDVDGVRSSWQAFREETVNRLSGVGCRTLWLDRGSHPRKPEERSGEISVDISTSGESSLRSSEAPPRHAEMDSPGGGGKPLDGNERRFRDGAWYSMVFDVSEACEAGVACSCELLLRVMSHRLVTVLVTDGDLRSLQAALWHGKPSVVLPTSPDQREAGARLVHSGAGVTCSPPCQPMDLTMAVVEAHDPGMAMRGAALRSGAALREAGGVFRAGNLLENELRTHQAASARRQFDVERPGDWHDDRSSLEDLSWYPDVPSWFWKDFSPLEMNLLDVYVIYGALVVGAGILMKMAWSIVWSFCDIATAPSLSKGAGGTGSTENHLRSTSPGPGNENRSNGIPTAVPGGKSGRLGGGKYWSSGSKFGKNGSSSNCKRQYCSRGNTFVAQPQQQGVGAMDTAPPGLSTPSTSVLSSFVGGKQSKKTGLTNGHS